MFSKKTAKFLNDLSKNNNRDWFNTNKHRYEDDVRTPALEFIESMTPALHRISPFFDASPKKVGGSLMRVYRDTRFGTDKTPYKTNIGIHFRHIRAKDVHAPGFYLHIEPKEVFFGAGIWRPESSSLKGIRTLIDEHPKEWLSLKKKLTTKSDFSLQGNSLKRPPKGFATEHPLIDDLKRKDFIAVCPLPIDSIRADDLSKQIAKLMRKSSKLMEFLCTADDLMY
ncbi:MAG: hypothetical protein ACI8VW_001117 [bacterium]|jgi:uncharacterized protein (TIGR02453 family)